MEFHEKDGKSDSHDGLSISRSRQVLPHPPRGSALGLAAPLQPAEGPAAAAQALTVRRGLVADALSRTGLPG
jgi:hypothetical protein